MNLIKKADHIVMRFIQGLMVCSIIFMSVILICNVLMRLFLNRSIVSAEELGKYCIIIVTFVGMGYVARMDKHVKISSLFDIMPLKGKKAMAILINLVSCGMMIFLSYHAYRYMIAAMVSGRVSSALQLPLYYVNGVVFIGFVLVAVEYFIEFLMNVTDRKAIYIGRKPYAEEAEGR